MLEDELGTGEPVCLLAVNEVAEVTVLILGIILLDVASELFQSPLP